MVRRQIQSEQLLKNYLFTKTRILIISKTWKIGVDHWMCHLFTRATPAMKIWLWTNNWIITTISLSHLFNLPFCTKTAQNNARHTAILNILKINYIFTINKTNEARYKSCGVVVLFVSPPFRLCHPRLSLTIIVTIYHDR